MPAARRLLARLIVTAAALTLLVGVLDATAATRQISASSVHGGAATFKLQSVAPTAIRAARLKAGHARRALKLTAVRAAARRGKLRVARVPASTAMLVLTLQDGTVRQLGEGGASGGSAKPSAGKPGSGGPASATGSGSTGGAVSSGGASSRPATGIPGSSNPATPGPSAPQLPSGGPSIPPPPAPEQIPADARYVAPDGSDADTGSAAAPWRTLAKAVAAAQPGDTVVLRSGSYGASGETTTVDASGTAAAPITFVGDPSGGRAALAGYIRITGSHLRLANLLFDGPTGRVLPVTADNPGGEEVKVSVMYGSDVEIRSSEVRGSRWHAGIYVNDATDVRLLSNHIHDNGDRSSPAQANYDHGIYWCSGSGVVAHNLIESNVSYGVHLYPTAAGVSVTRNTIVGNGKGGVIVADRASGNRIADNVIAHNALSGIKGYNLKGEGNVATGNVLWANGSRDLDGAGIALSGNVQTDPKFVGGGDYRVQAGSPAAYAGAFGTL